MGRSDMADKKKATDSEDSKKHGNEQLREEERLLVFFFFRLPIDRWGEEFGNQALVIRLQLFHVAWLFRFAIEIVRIEGPDGFKTDLVGFVAKVFVGAFTVPRIEAVVSDHRKTLCRQVRLIFEDVE